MSDWVPAGDDIAAAVSRAKNGWPILHSLHNRAPHEQLVRVVRPETGALLAELILHEAGAPVIGDSAWVGGAEFADASAWVPVTPIVGEVAVEVWEA